MKSLLPAILISLFSSFSMAQSLDIVDSKKIDIVVGLKDFSMIDVVGRKVQHVDVDYQKCEVASDRSQRVGKIIFKPASNEPFTMFVTDNHNDTYKINVTVDSNKLPDLFLVKNLEAEKQVEAVKSAEEKYKASTVKAIELTGGHQKAVHDLIRAMALNDSPKNTDVSTVNSIVPLWSEANIVETKNYRVGKLKGIIYDVENTSSEQMVLKEVEFYPVNEKTISVAIEKHLLNPGERTLVYIVQSK